MAGQKVKLTTSEVALVFQKVKLGKKKEIDFRAFEEGVRQMAMKTQVPYQELVDVAHAAFKSTASAHTKQGYLTKRPVAKKRSNSALAGAPSGTRSCAACHCAKVSSTFSTGADQLPLPLPE